MAARRGFTAALEVSPRCYFQDAPPCRSISDTNRGLSRKTRKGKCFIVHGFNMGAKIVILAVVQLTIGAIARTLPNRIFFNQAPCVARINV